MRWIGRAMAWMAVWGALGGCAGAGDALSRHFFGHCEHVYRSGVVAVSAVQSSGGTTGVARPLTQVMLGQIRLDGRPLDPGDVPGLVNASPTAVGLLCSVPCSFGTQAGKWEFSAYAAGHAGKPVSVGAGYAVQGRGCPSYSDQGTPVRLVLEPAR